MSSDVSQACERCSSFLSGNLSESEIRIHTDTQQLHDASLSCSLCDTLLQSINSSLGCGPQWPSLKAGDEPYQVDIVVKRLQSSHHELTCLDISTEAYVSGDGFSYLNYFIVQSCLADGNIAKQPFWRSEPLSTSEKVDLVKSWLHDCLNHHRNCFNKPRRLQLPRRLLSLGTTENPHLKLSCTDPLKAGANFTSPVYATLSYCWGPSGVTNCTKKATLSNHYAAIDEKELPLTIREAVSFTRAIGISYLWVDALCIIQDDIHDWQAEILNMSNIYEQSTLTLAASEARDCHGGLFVKRDTSIINVKGEPDTHLKSCKIGVSGRVYNIHIESRGTYYDGVPSSLHTRGWTMQEAALSHRMIMCTNEQLHWRCNKTYRTESGLLLPTTSTVYGSVPSISSGSTLEIPVTWWKLITSYSTRKFTIPEDRLPAILGISRYWEGITGDKNLVGLWKGTLPQDLLWMRIMNLSRSPLPDYLQALPSWTWLSCPVGIEYDYFGGMMREWEVTDHVKLHAHDVYWSKGPYLSQISRAQLTISGPVMQIYLSNPAKGTDSNPPYLSTTLDIPDFTSNLPSSCAAQFDREEQRPPGTFLCMLVRTRRALDSRMGFETFLILESVEKDKKYIRVRRSGLIRLSRPSGRKDKVAIDSFRRIGLGAFRGTVDCFDWDKRMTIDLV